MNTPVHKPQLQKRALSKPLALISLLALVAVPVMASAVTYGAPITINNPTPAQDAFGTSVSIDGNKFIVGAPYDSTIASEAGIAYLYDAMTGVLLQTLNNPAPAIGDLFGYSVAIYGDKVLISAPYDDTGATNAGSAYLYDATTGVLLQTFNNPTPVADDRFGWSVSLSDNKVLIGAPYDNTLATNAGSAYLYDVATGALLQTFNNQPGGGYGISVSLSGNTALIGATGNNIGSFYTTGTAYLYDATTGTLLQTFNSPALAPATNDLFGRHVFISDNNVLIGAPLSSNGTIDDVGTAYLYDATTGTLLQTFHSPTSVSGYYFGSSVSISGDKVLIGSRFNYTDATTYPGAAYLYDATTGVLLQTFNNPTPVSGDSFGYSISISGTTVLVGAPYDNTGANQAGSVYLYLPPTDTDGDGIEDGADNCPADANPDQTDTDSDGEGDICDFTPNGDTDSDGVDELVDNCPGIANPGQEDADSDDIGDVCDPTPNGDPDPDPTSIDQCQQLDWMDFSFRNQGQCVAFVNTGHDSR